MYAAINWHEWVTCLISSDLASSQVRPIPRSPKRALSWRCPHEQVDMKQRSYPHQSNFFQPIEDNAARKSSFQLASFVCLHPWQSPQCWLQKPCLHFVIALSAPQHFHSIPTFYDLFKTFDWLIHPLTEPSFEKNVACWWSLITSRIDNVYVIRNTMTFLPYFLDL